MSLKAYVLINTQIGKTTDVVKNLREMSEIKHLDVIMGPYDIIALVETDSHNSLSHMVLERLQGIEAIKHTMTCTVVNLEDAI